MFCVMFLFIQVLDIYFSSSIHPSWDCKASSKLGRLTYHQEPAASRAAGITHQASQSQRPLRRVKPPCSVLRSWAGSGLDFLGECQLQNLPLDHKKGLTWLFTLQPSLRKRLGTGVQHRARNLKERTVRKTDCSKHGL